MLDFRLLRSRLAQLNKTGQERFLAHLDGTKEAKLIPYIWQLWARDAQLPPALDPKNPWLHWVVIAGRGFGKTRTGAEFVRYRVCNERAKRINLIARTAADARDVMIEGSAGLLNVFPPHQRPRYFPGKRRIVFHTGAIGTILSAEKPEQLRGPECDTYWGDEFAWWTYIQKAWDNLMFGFRIGNPRGILTTSPRNIELLKSVIGYDETVVTGGSSYENMGNLAASYRRLIKRYEGTTLGKQEVLGLIISEVKGALWKLTDFDKIRVDSLPSPNKIKTIITSVDPSVSDDIGDECGIINLAIDYDDICYIFAEKTGQYTTNEWGNVVRQQHKNLEGNYVVAESNNGGALVRTEIQHGDMSIPVKLVHASRGKRTRAEPVHSLYEQNRIRHVGVLPGLEDEMSTWVPGDKSPNGLDASVWGVTDLYGLGQKDTPWWEKELAS